VIYNTYLGHLQLFFFSTNKVEKISSITISLS